MSKKPETPAYPGKSFKGTQALAPDFLELDYRKHVLANSIPFRLFRKPDRFDEVPQIYYIKVYERSQLKSVISMFVAELPKLLAGAAHNLLIDGTEDDIEFPLEVLFVLSEPDPDGRIYLTTMPPEDVRFLEARQTATLLTTVLALSDSSQS